VAPGDAKDGIDGFERSLKKDVANTRSPGCTSGASLAVHRHGANQPQSLTLQPTAPKMIAEVNSTGIGG
jgi:hypothetical protein